MVDVSQLVFKAIFVNKFVGVMVESHLYLRCQSLSSFTFL